MSAPKKRQPTIAIGAPIYHLKVSLEGIEPTIWRRFQVPGNASLGGCTPSSRWRWGGPTVTCTSLSSASGCIPTRALTSMSLKTTPRVLDENATAIAEVAPRVKSAFVYEYDFGDSWDHRITVEKILDPDPAAGDVRTVPGRRTRLPAGRLWRRRWIRQSA